MAARSTALLLTTVIAAGCASTSYRPSSIEEVGALARLQTQSRNGLEVSATVLSPQETETLFGADLAKEMVQPVWLDVRNDTDRPYLFFPVSLDRDYYSPLEAAWLARKGYAKSLRTDIGRFFFERRMLASVNAHSRASGFVFTHLRLGWRYVNVELVAENGEVERFGFTFDVPGMPSHYREVDLDTLWPKEQIVDLDDDGLRNWLATQPCCVTDKKGEKPGDPLNIVIIGARRSVWAFVRAGWEATEAMTGSSTWKTVKASLFGSEYRHSPVSSLYLYGRMQDIALQKVRRTLDMRNHLRLWLAPVTWKGHRVWLGQISRDIGVRFTTKSPTISTHKIDPDVDETRNYLMQDLIAAEGVERFGFATGVGAAGADNVRTNLTGDPYVTDGLRLVVFLAVDPVPLKEIVYLPWNQPPRRLTPRLSRLPGDDPLGEFWFAGAGDVATTGAVTSPRQAPLKQPVVDLDGGELRR